MAVVNVVDSGHNDQVVFEEEEEEEPTTPMLVAQFNCIEARCNRGEVQDQEPPTCRSILTTLCFGGNKRVVMECDMAASHNVLSLKAYKQIWPKKGPILHKQDVNVIMADGTKSALPIRSMRCSVIASND